MNSKIREYIGEEKIQSQIVPIDVFQTELVKCSKKETMNTNRENNVVEFISISLFGYETNQIEVFYKPISRVMNPDKIIKIYNV